MWKVGSLIDDEYSIGWENEIIKNGDDIKVWLSYYEIKSSDTSSYKQKVFILERAVRRFPRSFKLWKTYLDLVSNTFQGRLEVDLNIGMVIELFERSLRILDDMPMLWTRYLTFLMKNTEIMEGITCAKFNEALRCLPFTQHHHIWPLYITFADNVKGKIGIGIYRKYLSYENEDALRGVTRSGQFGLGIDQVIAKLIEFGDLNCSLSTFKSMINDISGYRGLKKSPLQIWNEFLDLIIEHIGEALDNKGNLVEVDDEMEHLVLKGLKIFKDQSATFYLKITNYFIKRNKHDKVRFHFKKGLNDCLTVNDFNEIYNGLIEFEESVIEALSKELEEKQADNFLDDELDYRMNQFENLLKSRSLLKNDMMLRQDINNLDEWFNRVEIFSDNLNKKIRTYVEALMSINPLKAHSLSAKPENSLSNLWIQYANIYSSSGDFKTADLILSKSLDSQFKNIDELASLYIEKSKIILSSGDEHQAVEVLKDALTPKLHQKSSNNVKLNSEMNMNLYKSQDLWSFYLELLESLIDNKDDNEHIKTVVDEYERMISLKVSTPLQIINYASFVESWDGVEKSFSVYEKGIKLFKDTVIVYDLWDLYLKKASQHQLSIERLRDLFDQCLFGNSTENEPTCPPKLCKQFFLMYANLERKEGSHVRALDILKRSIPTLTNAINHPGGDKSQKDELLSDKFDIYLKIVEFGNGLHDVGIIRGLYEMILNDTQLKLRQVLNITLRFIDFEESQNQYRRVRELYKYGCQLKIPGDIEVESMWNRWENFELNHGNEVSFKSMLKFKRQIEQDFETQELFRQSLNPMGFVKSSNNNIAETNVANPDSIDLDMDM